MRKSGLFILGLLPILNVGLDSAMADVWCEICYKECLCIQEQCAVDPNCDSMNYDAMTVMMQQCTSTMPTTALRKQAMEFIEQYGEMLINMNPIDLSADEICDMLGVCNDTPSGPTCTSSNCQSTGWRFYRTGYEVSTDRHCADSYTCVSRDKFQCAANYYGSSDDGISGCDPCPDGGKSAVGSTDIKSCYIKAGTDKKGTFTFSGGASCYHP